MSDKSSREQVKKKIEKSNAKTLKQSKEDFSSWASLTTFDLMSQVIKILEDIRRMKDRIELQWSNLDDTKKRLIKLESLIKKDKKL